MTREIKFLGNMKRGNDKQNYKYSVFECPICFKEVVRKTKDGLKQQFCSHECYAQNRKPRGAYNEKVEINGYLYIYMPKHPKSIQIGYVAEHRLIAESKIGRYLYDDEVVHHVNENKHDNRIGNLEIMTASEHNRLHANKRKRDKYGKLTI